VVAIVEGYILSPRGGGKDLARGTGRCIPSYSDRKKKSWKVHTVRRETGREELELERKVCSNQDTKSRPSQRTTPDQAWSTNIGNDIKEGPTRLGQTRGKGGLAIEHGLQDTLFHEGGAHFIFFGHKIVVKCHTRARRRLSLGRV